ncbi:MAG: hypothetical protein ACK521_05095 [bacterium]
MAAKDRKAVGYEAEERLEHPNKVEDRIVKAHLRDVQIQIILEEKRHSHIGEGSKSKTEGDNDNSGSVAPVRLLGMAQTLREKRVISLLHYNTE